MLGFISSNQSILWILLIFISSNHSILLIMLGGSYLPLLVLGSFVTSTCRSFATQSPLSIQCISASLHFNHYQSNTSITKTKEILLRISNQGGDLRVLKDMAFLCVLIIFIYIEFIIIIIVLCLVGRFNPFYGNRSIVGDEPSLW